MPENVPEVVIRIGSHAEKDYVLKLAPFFDGLIVGANLFEATPGATASLLVAVKAKNTKLFLDPMTYAYGAYIDPQLSKVRTDLDWIKSNQTRKGRAGKKTTVRDFKRSYKKLADRIGFPLEGAIRSSAAVSAEDFQTEKQQVDFCRRVAEYQLDRIREEFAKDDELRDYIEQVPGPTAVFAPYFYMEPTDSEKWLQLNLSLMASTAKLSLSRPVHAVLCAGIEHLRDVSFRQILLKELPKTGIRGVWLWFSRFDESSEGIPVLRGYQHLVQGLSEHMDVYAMHGGFYSLALSKHGMKGISHGVGYGEQKDVVPVIGQSTPTVRYYLPPVAQRLGVPDIERSFDALGIATPDDFHDRVCSCSVCKGVVSSSLRDFSSFGDMHRSRPQAKRRSQTPAAAKRCRFHFLLNRIRERDEISRATASQIASKLKSAAESWGSQISLKNQCQHLTRWAEALHPEE